MIAGIALAALLSGTPTGSARLDHGPDGVNLQLTSFETERVVAGKRGKFTSAELLFRTSSGARLDVRILFNGPGELPARSVTSLRAQSPKGGVSTWTSARRTGCRVRLSRGTPDAVAGKIVCQRPEEGEPFEAVFDAKR